MSNPDILQDRIEYRFSNPDKLTEALTHSSAAVQRGGRSFDNERLEYLGDAFLAAVSGLMLFRRLPEAPEGDLTRLRSQIVCEKNLAAVSRQIGLGDHLILGRGEERQGGRSKDSILADAVEALIGAVLTDGGYDAAEKLIERLFDKSVRDAAEGLLFTDHKSRLQETVHGIDGSLKIVYKVVGESGPDHDKTFRVLLVVGGKPLGEGSGKSKKEAEQEAARDALRKGIDNVF